MLLILPRNLPTCKLTVYKKCSSNKSRTNMLYTLQLALFSCKEPSASQAIISTGVYMFSRLISYLVLLKQGTKATTQTFPLNEQELIYIYFAAISFLAVEKFIFRTANTSILPLRVVFLLPPIQSWALRHFISTVKQDSARSDVLPCIFRPLFTVPLIPIPWKPNLSKQHCRKTLVLTL